MTQTTDPRIDAVRRHFHEWHGAVPDDTEIVALLNSIDMAGFGTDTDQTKMPSKPETTRPHHA